MALKDIAGQLSYSPQEITNILEANYTALYFEDPMDHVTAQSILEGLTLPNLTHPNWTIFMPIYTQRK